MVSIQSNISLIELSSFSIQTCNPSFQKCFSASQTSSRPIQTCYWSFQTSYLAIQNGSASKNAIFPFQYAVLHRKSAVRQSSNTLFLNSNRRFVHKNMQSFILKQLVCNSNTLLFNSNQQFLYSNEYSFHVPMPNSPFLINYALAPVFCKSQG